MNQMKTNIPLTIIVSSLLLSCSPAGGTSPTTAPLPSSTPDVTYIAVDLSPEDDAAFQKGLADISANRQGEIQITVQDEDGNPLAGYQVKYRQISRDFLFGASADILHAETLKQAGVNILNVNMDWKMLQPEDRVFDLETANSQLGIDELKASGWALRADGLYSQHDDELPTFFKNITHAEFLGKLYLHEATVVKRFAPAVDYWEAIKDPNYETHNPLDKMQNEYFEAMSTSVYAIRDSDPDALIEITFSDPCSELDDQGHQPALQLILDNDVDFDILKLQFHYSTTTQNNQRSDLSFAEMSACYDRYEEILLPYGKKITVEFSAPSEALTGQTGYWNQPWSEDAQAQYLVTAYSIFFSKHLSQGLAWGNASITVSSLFKEDGTPKKSFHALQELLESWITAGETVTGDDGKVNLQGFGGDYEIEIIDPANGESVKAQVHITEQNSASEIIIVP